MYKNLMCICSIDMFRVIHQTTDTVTTEGRCVPLFCVATNHSLSYTYQWESISDGKIGANSPVLWVNKAGSYKCTVSNGSIQCYSELITVADDDGKLGSMEKYVIRILLFYNNSCDS